MKITFEWKLFDEFKPAELYAVLQLRGKIFAVEQNEAFLDADGADINAWHLLGWSNEGNLIAYSRVILPKNKNEDIKFGRVAVDLKHRKKGIATQLVNKIFLRIEQSSYNNSQIQISAQLYLKDFYTTFGFRSSEEIHYAGKLPHITMYHPPLNRSLNKD